MTLMIFELLVASKYLFKFFNSTQIPTDPLVCHIFISSHYSQVNFGETKILLHLGELLVKFLKAVSFGNQVFFGFIQLQLGLLELFL